jgi:hypothetical protein
MRRTSWLWILAPLLTGVAGHVGARTMQRPVAPSTGERHPKPALLSTGPVRVAQNHAHSDAQLWERTIAVYLRDDLWNDRDEYDAGHALMVPLHAAFQRSNAVWLQQFREHFARFAERGVDRPFTNANRLQRLQYLYLCSRFVVLADRSGRPDLIPEGLIPHLYQSTSALWETVPAWQRGRTPFPGGMRERLVWKLDTTTAPYRFYRAIIDEENFLFAIAADLAAHERLSRPQTPRSTVLAEILAAALRVVRERGIGTPKGGWLFQPGFWADHPDYAYAGQLIKVAGMAPSPLSNVAEDTSHSHRWPLWLTSHIEAYPKGSAERRFCLTIRARLERQFYERVLIQPSTEFPAFRTTNYMDGWNGVYRWGYATQGPGNGYGPYELSGTMTLGWWTFLNSQRVRRMYARLADFPLPAPVLATYVGPNTTRERHPLVTDPRAYENGMRELMVRLAATLTRVEGNW